MFSLRNVGLNYGDLKVLEGFDFAGDKRQSICLFGASGVGKTSILNILAGIVKPQSGRVSSSHRRMAYIFQQPRLVPWFTVRENLAVGLYDLGLSPHERLGRVENILPLLGLTEFIDFYPGQLSGGMKQRVSVGRAFVIEPDLILLDEPFTGLDENNKRDMQRLLSSLRDRHSCTSVMVTHDVREAIKFGDRIAVLRGRPCRCTLDIYPDRRRKSDAAYVRRLAQTLLDEISLVAG